MKNLVVSFQKARDDLLKLLDKFPAGKRETILLDKWSLKNLLSHLTGWAKYQTTSLREFKKSGEIKFQKNLKKSINDDFVALRKDWNWNKVYNEFLKASESLIKEYKTLSGRQWKQSISKNKEETPADFIKIEINHYNKTHGPQINKALKSLI